MLVIVAAFICHSAEPDLGGGERIFS